MFEPINDRDGKTGEQAKNGDAADEGCDFALKSGSFQLDVEEGGADLAKCGCAPGCGNV